MSDQGFPKTARLLATADFKRVFTRPRRSSDRYFTVNAVRGHKACARLGLAVAKRQVRHAVDRNRLKRITRECFRALAAGLGPIDFVVLARSDAVSATNSELRQSLGNHFRRLARQLSDPADPVQRGARADETR